MAAGKWWSTTMGASNMPIDPRMVKWEEPKTSGIDPKFVKWDDAPDAPKSAKPYAFDSSLIPSLMSIGQGASLGWMDELLGNAGLVDPERYRATVAEHESQHPWSSAMGKIGGAMLMPFGAGYVAGASPFATALTAGSLTTAAQMAGDAPEGDRLNEGSKGALMGLALGPAAMLATKPVTAVGDALLSQASKLPVVGENIASALARRRVAEGFSRDGINIEDIGPRMTGELGPEARLVDAGGKSVRSALDVNAVLPGQTGNKLEQAIENRIKGRTERLGELADMAGGQYSRASDVLDELLKYKQQASSPLYEKLHQINLRPTEALTSQVEAAMKLGAGTRAQEIATANRVDFTLNPADQTMSMRDLDHLKQGLDDLILKNTDPEGKMNNVGSALNNLRKDMLKQLDFLTADKYKAARDAFAGPAALEDAVKAGMRFMTQDGVKLERSLATMSESEKEAFKIGAAAGLRTKAGTGGGATELINASRGTNDNLKEKLRLMYGDDVTFSKAIKLLEREGKLKKMESLGRGSQTAERQFAAQDQAEKYAADVGAAMVGAPTGFWPTLKGLASGRAVQESSLGTPEPVRDALGSMLLGRHSPQELELLKLAQENLRRRAAAESGVWSASASNIPGLISN